MQPTLGSRKPTSARPAAERNGGSSRNLRSTYEAVRANLSSRSISRWVSRSVRNGRLLGRFSVVAALAASAFWYYRTESREADYVPLALLFVSAIAAIRGKSWDDTRQGMSRLTLTGYLLAALALIGLAGGIRDTQTSHSQLAGVETIQRIAYEQLMTGVSMVLFPITSTWRDPPATDLELLSRAADEVTITALRNTRLVPHPDPGEDFVAMTEDTRFFLISPQGARLTTQCGVPHQGFRAIYELFDFCVASGYARIMETQQTFIGALDAETIALLHEVLDDEFFQSNYRNLAQHEALFYQGMQAETGRSARDADQTWLALLQITRDLFSEESPDDSEASTQEESPWLVLGTYYFDGNTDMHGYHTFVDKVRKLVLHVGKITGKHDLIDSFR